MRDQLKVRMPEEILARMAGASSPEAAKVEGIAIAREMLAEARAMVQGVQVSAPFGKYKAAALVLGDL
jgi:homocysteine S-methyltransferase